MSFEDTKGTSEVSVYRTGKVDRGNSLSKDQRSRELAGGKKRIWLPNLGSAQGPSALRCSEAGGTMLSWPGTPVRNCGWSPGQRDMGGSWVT